MPDPSKINHLLQSADALSESSDIEVINNSTHLWIASVLGVVYAGSFLLDSSFSQLVTSISLLSKLGFGSMIRGLLFLSAVIVLLVGTLTQLSHVILKEKRAAKRKELHDSIEAELNALDSASKLSENRVAELEQVLKSLEVDLATSRQETISDMKAVISNLDTGQFLKNNVKDIQHDLHEMTKCLETKSYRAVLVLAGRVLELLLKINLINLKVEYREKAMIGELIELHAKNGHYIDPAVENTWNIINQQRIIGVHDKTNVPIPSLHQALMVCHAILDVTYRVLVPNHPVAES